MPTTSDTEDEDKQSKYPGHSKSSKADDSETESCRVDLVDGVAGGEINKLTEIIQEFRDLLTRAKFCAECSVLRAEVSSLISELELYRSSVPTRAVASAASTPSKKRRHRKNLANELGETLHRCVPGNWETRQLLTPMSCKKKIAEFGLVDCD